jgi:hypothetical protein
MQEQVKKIGTHRKVNVVLTDGTARVGIVKTLDDSSFSLDEGKQKGVVSFRYADISSIRPSPLTTGQKVAVAVGVTAVVAAVVVGIGAYAFYHH